MARSHDNDGHYTNEFINAFRVMPGPVTATVTQPKETTMPRKKALYVGQAIHYSYPWGVSPYWIVRIARNNIQLMDKGGARTAIPRLERNRQYELSVRNAADAVVLAEKRSDGYWHYALIVGSKLRISAGCQSFGGAASAKRHWQTRRRADGPYNRKIAWLPKGGGYSNMVEYDLKRSKRFRDRDRELNRWSLRFVRKAEKLRDKTSR